MLVENRIKWESEKLILHEEIKTDIHLGGIQVSGMLHGPWVIAIVSVLDYWIKDFSKHLQRHLAKKSRALSLD